MTPDNQPGQIPQSPALREATADSLAELLSRDPEGFSQQDLARVIEALRAQRTRQEASAKLAASQPAAKRPSGARLPAPSATSASAEELDL